MQINSVAAGYHDPAALGSRTEAAEASKPQPDDTSPAAAAASPAGLELGEILAQYDIHDITPADFSEMLQQLYQASILSEEEYQQLSTVRVDLDQAGIDADESIDLVEFYADKLKELARDMEFSDNPALARQQLPPARKRLDWMQKFSLLQSAPEGIGVDAVV